LELLILIVVFFALLILTFRAPAAPRLDRLIFFLLLLAVTGVLGFMFAVKVLEYNPNPDKLRLAHFLTENKLVDLTKIAPGVFDLDYVIRLDTDGDPEVREEKDPESRQEWVVLYRYDVVGAGAKKQQGPFGAAIYDYTRCRPPAIESYELVPVSYDYLAEDSILFVKKEPKKGDLWVENIIKYADPQSVSEEGALDRPEVIIFGRSRGVRTDLNVFRKVGVESTCTERTPWVVPEVEQCPNPIYYENIGSFRGSYSVGLEGNVVTVVDRGGFERSQLTVRRRYEPGKNGSYFKPGTQVLRDPVEYSLGFGPGQPDEVSQVYYPEKAVLAFYLNLGKDEEKLEKARSYLSEDVQGGPDFRTNSFGLPAAASTFDRVLVQEIRYQPNIEAEIRHEVREVTVTIVGLKKGEKAGSQRPCHVTWEVVGAKNLQAQPYGCEWKLEAWSSDCAQGK